MAKYKRANAWNKGGDFNNPDLLWYAKGVGKMMTRALNDTASWWFFAAIHGEYVTPANDPGSFPGWAYISGPPAVPTTPLPDSKTVSTYWNQCQHQSWFFLPWHRGYLLALEAQLREDIVAQGGPSTWALPYWDYFGPGNEFDIPKAFTEKALPDGTPNPLFVTARYGPYADNVVFDATESGVHAHPPVPPQKKPTPVTQKSLSNTRYTGSDRITPLPGFGGPLSGFWHGGTYKSGNLEQDPHNLTHVYVGGIISDSDYGLMADPGIAALDAIFYLHHANIDRLWAVWNSNPKHKNPTDTVWIDGPAGSGENEFIMPMPGGKSWVYTPRDVHNLSEMNYTYENLHSIPIANVFEARLSALGAAAPAAVPAAVPGGKAVELVGASQGPLSLKGSVTSITVKLDTQARQKVSASLAGAATNAAPDRVYLDLENIRGTRDASVLNVYINLPEGSDPADHPELLAGTVALFGLRRATSLDIRHAGGGLSFLLDISPVVDRLYLSNQLNTDSLQVTIVPNFPVSDQSPITVGQISIYREGL